MHDTSVVFAFDAKYAKYCAVALHSVLKHCKSRLNVHCISKDASDDDLARIKNIADRHQAKITFHRELKYSFDGWKVTEHFSLATYYRILIPYIVEAERALYLDSDLIATCDITPLLNMELRGNLVAGCAPLGGEFGTKMPTHDSDTYLNMGVVLMDLALLRDGDFLRACGAIHDKYKDRITWLDQCIINEFAKFRKLILNPRWNVLVGGREFPPQERRLDAYLGRVILHGAGPTKPWMEWADPRVQVIWRSYAEEVFDSLDEVLQKPSTIGDYMTLAKSLQRQGKYHEASRVTDDIIRDLLRQISSLMKKSGA
ncbi:MAG TPA: glycosyltransferase family 8 protein [Beijerinckiaceae bacterium]|jgi:lipopolysaccharide biosynthesis glycosyltransferase